MHMSLLPACLPHRKPLPSHCGIMDIVILWYCAWYCTYIVLILYLYLYLSGLSIGLGFGLGLGSESGAGIGIGFRFFRAVCV